MIQFFTLRSNGYCSLVAVYNDDGNDDDNDNDDDGNDDDNDNDDDGNDDDNDDDGNDDDNDNDDDGYDDENYNDDDDVRVALVILMTKRIPNVSVASCFFSSFR